MTALCLVTSRRVITTLLLVLLLLPATATTRHAEAAEPDAEARFVSLINAERRARGLSSLTVVGMATRVARDWSATMAADNDLYHRPNLGSAFGDAWRRLGENVGYGSSVDTLHDAFMDSPAHRANILGDFNLVGVGVVQTPVRMWVTVNFIAGTASDYPLFWDARSSSHRPAIESVWTDGVVSGCRSDRYCPRDRVTRAQMASFLARALGLTPRSESFSDVSSSNVHAGAIGALSAAGITTGCDRGRFCPDQAVNRAQMAAFIDRAFDLRPGIAVFLDTLGHPLADSIAAVAAAGITRGCGLLEYCPADFVTRDQMATFLDRALAL